MRPINKQLLTYAQDATSGFIQCGDKRIGVVEEATLKGFGIGKPETSDPARWDWDEVVSAFGAACSFVPFCVASVNDDGTYSVRETQLGISIDGFICVPYKSSYSKGCGFQLYDPLYTYIREKCFESELTAPHKMGVVTEKKLRAWAEYLRDERSALVAWKSDRDEAVRKALALIKLSGGDTGSPDKPNFDGRIHRPPFTLNWEISKHTGELSTRIELMTFAQQGLEVFKGITNPAAMNLVNRFFNTTGYLFNPTDKGREKDFVLAYGFEDTLKQLYTRFPMLVTG